MFKKKKRTINPNATDTLIGEGTIVEGKITSRASLRVEGKVKGDIECSGDVTIGETGTLHSSVSARNVINAGSIYGSVTTKGILTITPTGKVYGDIQMNSLQIAQGGLFQGTSKMEVKAAVEKIHDKDKEAKSPTQKTDKIAAMN
jgi:cytoskeletal protein CcmA (bactofilin family)